MSVLGGVDLGSDIYIENEFEISRVHSVMVRARDQTPLIFEQSAGPQPFDLVGESNRGALTKVKMNQLQQLASVVDSELAFIYNGETKTVRFRHWEPPVLAGELIVGREQTTDNAFYRNIRIKLMEV